MITIIVIKQNKKMENVQEITNNLNLDYKNLITSIIIILVSIVFYKSITYLLLKSEQKDIFNNKKSKTYVRLIKSIIRYVFIIITVLILLQINGINVSSLLAGVGILGIVIGLAIQDWIKDIIRGSSILSDNYFQVGDVVKYKEIEGKVLVLGLKTTKIQDLKTSNIISIANRNIEQIEVVSNLQYIKVPMPYEVKLEKAEKAMEDIVNLVKQCNEVTDSNYLSVAELGDSAIEYMLKVEGDPHKKLQIRRDCLRCILVGLEKNGIEVPYKQIDIHQK